MKQNNDPVHWQKGLPQLPWKSIGIGKRQQRKILQITSAGILCSCFKLQKKDDLEENKPHGQICGTEQLLYQTVQRQAPRIFWTTLIGVMRRKLNFLTKTINLTFGKKSTRSFMKSVSIYCEMHRCIADVLSVCYKVTSRWSNLIARWMLTEHIVGKCTLHSLEAAHRTYLDTPI